MPENDLAHDLNRRSRSRGIGSGMSSQIMGPETDPDEFSCLLHHDSCRRVGNGKDLFLRLYPFLPDVLAQAVGQFLGDKGNLSLTTTLGRLNADSAPVDVRGRQLKHFPDSHPSPCHHFQDQPVPLIRGPKDDLIDGFLFHDLPGHGSVVFEDLPKHRGITGICESLHGGVYDEGEKGTKKGKAESLGGLLKSLGQVPQEGQDLLRGKGLYLPVTELGRKLGEKMEVIPERVFFSSSSCGNQEKTLWLGTLS
jgi:hypothetical protein